MILFKSSVRKIFLLAIFTCLFFVCNAQKRDVFLHYEEVDSKKFHFGFSLGINYMDYNFRYNKTSTLRADVVSVKPGFYIGGIVEHKLSNDFAIRTEPGLQFGSRSISFSKGMVNKEIEEGIYNSIYIDIPLLLKYKAKKMNNTRPYLVGGFGIKYDISANNKYVPEKNIYIRTLPLDFYYKIGFGVDWYFSYFKWSTELRFSIGLRDILNNTIYEEPFAYGYTESIDRMNSKIVSVVFHFE